MNTIDPNPNLLSNPSPNRVSPLEIKQILQVFNGTASVYPKNITILKLFGTQVQKSPESVAVISGKKKITYRALDEASNQLARYLRSKGIREETMVPILMERSLELVIGILGILKAGAAYVPIDPEHPRDRIEAIVRETGALWLLTDRLNHKAYQPGTHVQRLVWEEIHASLLQLPVGKVQTNLTPSNLAYVIFTSGSTGTPKGVMVEHAQLVASTLARNNYYSPWGNVLLIPSVAFDASVAAIFGSIGNGNCLILCPQDQIKDPAQLKSLLADTNTILCIPSYYHFLLDEGLVQGSRLSTVIVGGEVLDLETVSKHFAKASGVTLYNEYGPTEATVWSTVQKIETAESRLSIGAPIANTQVYILGPEGELLPIGFTGELHIAGNGIARGYLNQDQLTAQKFIKNPFSQIPGSRMYKTGDLGYWRPDGTLVYMGRVDDQVKIQGQRIELGEIESVMLESGLIKQALVVPRALPHGTSQLLAYFVPKPDFEQSTVERFLKDRLPIYMLPSVWIELKKFPLNTNGKIDKNALPLPLRTASEEVEPETQLEKTLAEIWKNLLHLEQVYLGDNFFSIGGNSLLAMRVISKVRKELKMDIGIRDFFANPTLFQFASVLQSGAGKVSLPPLREYVRRPPRIPLSFSQESLWFIDQLEGTIPYHLPIAMKMEGELNIIALDQTLKKLLARHEVLRTVIRDGREQHVLPWENWKWSYVEGGDYREHEEEFKEFLRGLANAPFDLSSDYMLRATLVRLDRTAHVLVLVLHHIAFDAWSTTLLLQDLLELYKAYNQGEEPDLPALPIQYADFALWQKENFDGDFLEKKTAYWIEKLEGLEPMRLPTDQPPSGIPDIAGGSAFFTIDPRLSEKIGELAAREGATLFMALLAAFKVLLYRYSAHTDICVGTAIAGRQAPETEDLVGYFINTLALRTQVEGTHSFKDVLKAVKTTTLEAFENQDLPFEKVVAAVGADRVSGQNPLFQVMFLLQNLPRRPPLNLKNLQLSFLNYTQDTAKFPLTFSMSETAKGLMGIVEYRAALFSDQMIKNMIGHYRELLKSIVTKPEQKVGSLTMLGATEEQRLLHTYNDTSGPYPKDKTVIDFFEERVKFAPDDTAVVFEEKRISYQELDDRANQLAHLLRSKGVNHGTPVLIGLERSVEMIVGLLGILKAGGSYVPIDPDYPQERIKYMREDSGAQWLVSSQSSRSKMQALDNLETIYLDRDADLLRDQPRSKPEGQPDPQQLAYVMYTSGSTGTPKGVMIGHDNAGAFISWCREEFKSSRFDVVYATTSICFDLSVFEIFFPLSIGKPIRILENGLHIARHLPGDTSVLLNTVPGVIQSLLNESVDWSKVAMINMAGETIPAGVLEKLDTENIEVRNLYGPTEDTTYSTVYRLKPGAPLYIGKPIANTQIYILNKEGALTPEGVPGEICISGAGVARGYLNRPELTAEKFVPNPFDRDLYAILYKTGDRGRWMNGNIEFLGREDDQVKIRGYRIELGEIEKVLQAYGTVKEAAVLAKENGRGEKQLVAYLVTEPGLDEAAIVGFLKSRLPGFMIPSLWIWLDKFPRTPNGKIDKNALPHPGADGLVDRKFAAPRTVQENRMAQIWAKVLDRTRVGIHDNFFELGGHSLLATTLMLELREQLKVELSIKDLFDHPTIAELSKVLDLDVQAVDRIPLVKVVPRPEKIPLSFNQESLWFIDQLEGSVQYHLPTVLRLNGPLDKEALEKALRSVLERHEVLRTVVRNTDGRPFQLVLPTTGWECSTVDQTLLRDKPEDLRDFILDTVHKPFDLAMDYLFRASLIILGKDQHILILTMHHIASDGWSVPLLLREITSHYLHFLNLRKAPEALPIQYADFALWQRNVLTESYLRDRGQYWKTKLRDLVPLRLPQDYPHPQVPSFRGATCGFFINNRLKAGLMSLAQEEGATLYMTLLAAFKLMLYRYSAQTDICVGTAMSGRNQKEIEQLIGYFINSLPLRSTVDPQSTYRDFLKVVKATCLEAFEHQDMPFDRIVAAVGAPRDLGRNPLFQVMFVLQNLPEFRDSDFAGVKIQREIPVQNTSKFDFTFILNEDPSGMEGTVEYRTDLFRASSIQKMTDSYLDILEAMVAAPGDKVNGDTNPVTKDADDPGTALPVFVPVHQMLTETAEKFGGDAAIFLSDQWISYRELNERANQLAHLLIEKGLQVGDAVGIFMHRSIEMVVSIHATLKAGGVYLPIDTEYPERRVKYFLEDSSAAFLITQQIFKDGFTDVPVIAYEEFAAARTQYSSDNPEVKVRPNDAAYLIYTSGSTGKPKGVIIEHGNLYNLIHSAGISPGMSASDKILGTTSISFDVSILELILPFVHGAKLYLMDRYQRKDPEAVLRSMAAHHITYLFATPTLLKMLLNGGWEQAFPSLNVCSAGEPLSKALAGRLMPLSQSLWNLYGPSETTVFSTLKQITDQEEDITIGHPIHNTRVYILRDNMEPVQGDEEGELYISGRGVGRGYLNRSKLSAEKFMEDPFHRSGTYKMYRTGDMGRFSAAGEIVITGRKDHQVKLRGHRIELGEIEHALANFKNIKDALVTVREDESGNAKLVAYLTLSGKDNPAAKSGEGSKLLEEKHYNRVKKWKKELSDFLPQVMVPTDFVVMENFPVTASGKIDWQALPAPESNVRLDPEAAALEETPGEKLIAGIWKEALGIKNLGLTDNFFEIGGHSLIAIQVMTRLENESGIKLPLSILFKYPTVQTLALALESKEKEIRKWNSLVPIKPYGHKPPLYIVHGAGLNVLPFYAIANNLDPGQPVYGLQAKGLDGIETPLTSVEEIAAHYIKEILEHNPQGPYALAGYSFGGILAFEMAKQLKAVGKEVQKLIMFDTYAYLSDHKESWMVKLTNQIRYLIGKRVNDIQLLVNHPQTFKNIKLISLRKKKNNILKFLHFKNTQPQPEMLKTIKKIEAINREASKHYVFKKYPGNLFLLRAKIRTNYIEDPVYLGWKPYVDNVNIIEVEGKHTTMFTPPHDKKFARVLQEILDGSEVPPVRQHLE